MHFIPGKGTALSSSCYPEVVLGDLPNIYPYIINNPGEGAQAKRRTSAVIVDHLIPPMTRADIHGDLRQLEQLLDEYAAVQSLDPGKAPVVLEEINRLIERAQLHRDLDFDQAFRIDDLPALLARIDGYLCEIKEAQIRDGLHVLGRLPAGDQLIDLLFSLVRQDNGPVPSLPRALAHDLGIDYLSLLHNPGLPHPSPPLGRGGNRPGTLSPAGERGESARHPLPLGERVGVRGLSRTALFPLTPSLPLCPRGRRGTTGGDFSLPCGAIVPCELRVI